MAFQPSSTNPVLRVHTPTGYHSSETSKTAASQKLCFTSSIVGHQTPSSQRQTFPIRYQRINKSESTNNSTAGTIHSPNKGSRTSVQDGGRQNNTSNSNINNCNNNSNNVTNFAKLNIKNEALLDRKAFISLEKSINWQALIDLHSLHCHNDHASHSGQAGLTFPLSDSVSGKGGLVTQTQEFTLPGMKDVPAWLKLLRLHKYSNLFAQMSYEQMLNLSESELENRNITKGARQKLVLSIQKLKVRSHVLIASELDLIDVKNCSYRKSISLTTISQAFCQIRAFLSTPIRPPIIAAAGQPVDINNNNCPALPSIDHRSRNKADTVHQLCQLWVDLDNFQFVDILTRIVGHLCHNLVTKCKKRLQIQNLWSEHFAEYYSIFENKSFLQKIIHSLTKVKVDKTKVMLSNHSKCEEDDDDDDDESSDSSSSPHSTDSGVEAGDSGDDQRHYDGEIYTPEKEETFYSELQMILDKCLEHDAFSLHSVLFREWHSQLAIMRLSLRNQLEQSQAASAVESTTTTTTPLNAVETVSLNASFVRATSKNGHFGQQQHQLQKQQAPVQQQQQQPPEVCFAPLGQKSYQTSSLPISTSNLANKHHSQHHHPQQASANIIAFHQYQPHNHHQQQQAQSPSTLTSHHHQQQHHRHQSPFKWPLNSSNLNAGHSQTQQLRQFNVVNGNSNASNNNNHKNHSNNNHSVKSIMTSVPSSSSSITDYLTSLNPQWNAPRWIEKTPTLEMNESNVWSPLNGHHVQSSSEWSQQQQKQKQQRSSIAQSSIIPNPELNHSSQSLHQSQWPTMAMDSDIERLCIKMAEDALNGTCLEDK